ncbi:MAG: hypothetical protein KAR12_02575, partial [Methylococcales bacterium]|nr:hypothetical protein [Methylococcales bacterium]
MKYKYIYKTAVFLLFSGFFFIPGSTFMLTKSLALGHWEWVIYGSSFVMFVSSIIIVVFRQKSSEKLELNARERKIKEGEEQLQQLQKEYQRRQSLIFQKENDIKQKLIQYQQYIEFPDDKEWEDYENNEYFDDEVAQLLQDKAEIIFDKIINKRYTENKIFKNELLLDDIVDLIDSVARIHHPDSQHPLLETSIENLLRSLNRLSLQLLVLVDSFPVNIKEYNLRKTYFYIQKSATTIGYYKKAEPFLTFVTPVLRIGMAANPMVGIAQTVAIEAGKQVIKKGSEKYALNLLHDVIEIIGEQASTIFGEGSLRYRSKHWIYAVELTEIIHLFNPVKPEDLSKAMKIINGLLMRSEYDRIFIYNCLAQGRSPGPERFENDFINKDDKQKIVRKLSEFIENQINKDRNEAQNKKMIDWRNKVESRLGMKIRLNIDQNDADYLKNILSSGSPEKKIKPFLARYILTTMTEGETPQFIYTDIHFATPISQSLEGKELWLIGSNRRLVLLSADKQDKIIVIWCYDSRQKQQLLL